MIFEMLRQVFKNVSDGLSQKRVRWVMEYIIEKPQKV